MLNEFIAIDLETTGIFPPERQQIIEYGCVRFREGKAVEEFQLFVSLHRSLPPFITRLTGIRREDLAGAPGEEEAFRQFLDFAGDAPLVAHNMAFDFAFLDLLSRLYLKKVLANPLICTLVLARELDLPVKNRRLSTLSEYFRLPEDAPHRALEDARRAGLLYLRLAALKEDDLNGL